MQLSALGSAARKQAQAQLKVAPPRVVLGDGRVVSRGVPKAPRVPSTGEERFAQQWRGVDAKHVELVFREFRFEPGRRWRFDFAWPARMVALEVEGITHEGGRHQRLRGFQDDCRKYATAQLKGWIVIRVTPYMVRTGEALRFVEAALKARENVCYVGWSPGVAVLRRG